VIDVIVPQHGMGMTEGDVVEWLVKLGDDVQEGQALAEIDTSKAVVAIESPAGGTVAEILAEVGDTVEVGAVIARLVAK
jgi:pyruvate/2-oxoglutarate dehydrogenase complex dihydrolipoamide acyltransferase (E2) component